jgi:uncharacterized protein (UPF0335 family)
LKKIPSSVEAQALSLWLQGNAYRSITNKLRISLGVLTRIINDKKRSVLDLDELRKLNVLLMKSDSSVYDAVKGAKLLGKVNELGIDLERLEGVINIVDKISSERNVEAEKFIGSAMKLTEFEAKTGKPYHEIVGEFEDKQTQMQKLDLKVKELDSQRAKIQGELSQATEKLSKTLEELKHIISTKERLEKLGLERVSDLARFVEDFELLGFDANAVRELAGWRKSLAEIGIDPDMLESFIREKGSLEKQISELEKERRRVEGSVKKLRDEHLRLFEETASLQAEVLKLSKLGRVVKLGKVIIQCRVCGREGVFVKLLTASEYRSMMSSRGVLQYRCFNCGQWVAYTPWEILTAVGLLAAPELKEAQTPTAKD